MPALASGCNVHYSKTQALYLAGSHVYGSSPWTHEKQSAGADLEAEILLELRVPVCRTQRPKLGG